MDETAVHGCHYRLYARIVRCWSYRGVGTCASVRKSVWYNKGVVEQKMKKEMTGFFFGPEKVPAKAFENNRRHFAMPPLASSQNNV